MRNVDKIRQLERELARHQKKVHDDGQLIAKLQRNAELARGGLAETNRMVDAILTAVVLQEGKPICEEEKILGWNLSIPRLNVAELCEKYELHARVGEGGYYSLGVVPREAANAEEAKADHA